MKGYRCDQDGTWHDGEPAAFVHIDMANPLGSRESVSVDLCPTCAPDVIAPLVELAKTKHEVKS